MIDSLRICVKNRKAMDALCNAEFTADAIEQLVKERDELVTKCHRLEKERDAAINDISISESCLTCNHKNCHAVYGCEWEWRGVQEVSE